MLPRKCSTIKWYIISNEYNKLDVQLFFPNDLHKSIYIFFFFLLFSDTDGIMSVRRQTHTKYIHYRSTMTGGLSELLILYRIYMLHDSIRFCTDIKVFHVDDVETKDVQSTPRFWKMFAKFDDVLLTHVAEMRRMF